MPLISQHFNCGHGRPGLRMYAELRKDGGEPSPRTFVNLLKACRSSQDLERAKRIHAEVVRCGFQSDLYVSTMLVNAYTKCRSLLDARDAFDKMPCRDVVSWTAMILGYAQMDKGEEALRLYSRMQQEGVVPNDRTYVGALKACSRLAVVQGKNRISVKQRCLGIVRAIHADIRKGNFELDPFVGNMLLDGYAKCGSLEDAKHVFERMPRRDVVSWNAMIFGYAQMGEGADGLQLFACMQQEGIVPDARTYVSALKACSSLVEVENCHDSGTTAARTKCLEAVRAIHRDVVERNVEDNGFVGNMLVDVYAKCGSLEDARCVFENILHRDVVSWNSMILGYAQMNKGEEALRLYTRMQTESVVPNDRTYVSALKACSSTLAESEEKDEREIVALRATCLQTVTAIHKQILKGKFEADVFVGTALVDVYARCGSLQDARCVFEKMPHRSVASWNAMIFGYAQTHEAEDGLQLFTRMHQESVVPDGWTYVSVLKACSSLAEWQDSNRGRYLETVRGIHSDVVKGKFESDVFVGNTLVDVYAKCGSMEDARRVFARMQTPNVVAWTSMILGYTHMDNGEHALQLYAQMQQAGVVPNARTYVSALKACGSVAGLEKGKEIHAQILKSGLEVTHSFVISSLIDMYGKCGSMVDAQQLFDSSPTRDIVAWSALIAGYAHQGESRLVFDLFKRMKHEGIQPDGITFLGVLTACSNAGLVDRGQKYFEAMIRDYGISATMEHYTCMVDLFGRAGHLAKAMEVAKAIPFQPASAVWKCVLGACRKWRNVGLGKQAFECAVRLDNADAATYVLMANIYSAAHMWGEANEMQALRVKSRAWKQQGQSRWTDSSGFVHVFVVGHRGHPESQDIYAKLGDLLVRMKKAGYVPHLESVLRDIPEDKKEDALCGHSERLAIAYALLKTAEGTSIRVVKNLRVCEDCHTATALISRIEQRTIICRDASRFHVFKDGKCSCGDYW